MTPRQVLIQARTLLTASTWRQGNYDGLHPARARSIPGKLDILEAIWEASGHNPDDANAAIDALKARLPAGQSLSGLNDSGTLAQLRTFLQQASA